MLRKLTAYLRYDTPSALAWVMLAGSVLTVFLWYLSGWYALGLCVGPTCEIVVHRGDIRVICSGVRSGPTRGTAVGISLRIHESPSGFLFALPSRVGAVEKAYDRNRLDITIPLWLVFALVALMMGILVMWRRTLARRIRQRGVNVCPRCEYDLRGNISGICPECGLRSHTTESGLTRFLPLKVRNLKYLCAAYFVPMMVFLVHGVLTFRINFGPATLDHWRDYCLMGWLLRISGPAVLLVILPLGTVTFLPVITYCIVGYTTWLWFVWNTRLRELPYWLHCMLAFVWCWSGRNVLF